MSNNPLPSTTTSEVTTDDDEFENLNLSFDDLMEEDDYTPPPTTTIMNNHDHHHGHHQQQQESQHGPSFSSSSPSTINDVNNNDPTVFEKNHAGQQSTQQPPTPSHDDYYILGTLIVRVVAARDLESVIHNDGLGQLLFGHGRRRSAGQHHHNHHGGGYHHGGGGGHRSGYHHGGSGGSSNPYASVRFGNTTQRTSEVYDTVDPIWPRGETMYMDVTHAALDTLSNNATAGDDNELRSMRDSMKDNNNKGGSNQQHASVAKAAPRKDEIPQQQQNRRHPRPVLTVAVFHASEMGKMLKYPNKDGGGGGGDSDDRFLGMAAVDLTELLTGKIRTFDEWLYLSGTESGRGSVRLVCEYEPSDSPPDYGDLVRFTNFCHPDDLYPAVKGRLYKVEQSDGDNVLVSWSSPEGWVSTFLVHRCMLICEERHHGPVDYYQDELASLAEKLSHSPLVHTVQRSVGRVPDDGLVAVSLGAIQGGASVLTRWLQDGPGAILGDVVLATNWDGRFNPTAEEALSTLALEDDDHDDNIDQRNHSTTSNEQRMSTSARMASASASNNAIWEPDASLAMAAEASVVVSSRSLASSSSVATSASSSIPSMSVTSSTSSLLSSPLPNMPPCPITGEPMRDPVVAGDGHTYERTAIARWLETSDMSPLTGSVLPHKNLVPNYMLVSSLQESAAAAAAAAAAKEAQQGVASISDDDEPTTEVNIDD